MKKFFIVMIVLNIINISLLSFLFINDKKYKSVNSYSIKLNGDSLISKNINDKYDEEGATYSINDEEKEALIDSNIDLSKTGKTLIRYYSDYDKLNSYNIYRIINVKDDIPPVIKLKGEETIDIYVGQKYEDYGYEVTDNSNEDLSKKVTVTGKVDTKTKGKYEITYTIVDSSGNKAVKKRIINVKEKKKVTTEKRTVTQVIAKEKDSSSTKKVDLNKNSNTVTAMSFTNKGIKLSGYVKDSADKYVLKLCSGDNCKSINTSSNKNDYSTNIELSNYENGTYKMLLEVDGKDYDIVDELDEQEKIVRAKIGDKLVTVLYESSTPSIKVEDFKYEYDVLIDAGHGGSDSGATNKYVLEKNINLEQTLYEKKRFEDHGLKVLLMRSNDSNTLLRGSSSLPNLRRRALAFGYYGVVSKIVYSNHHNSISNKKFAGYEILLTNQGTKSIYSAEYKIAAAWEKVYPNLDNHIRIYGRNYDTDSILSKESGQVYNIKNYYAMQRIPYNLYNIYTVTYEGCYLSNLDDYNWYVKNWKMLSEIKIKYYVESLGITYKE